MLGRRGLRGKGVPAVRNLRAYCRWRAVLLGSILTPMKPDCKVRGLETSLLFVLLCAAAANALPAQTLTTLMNFDLKDGAYPLSMSLIQGTDGNYYGTTAGGGTSKRCTYFNTLGCGTVFKITSDGTLTTLHSFDLIDGYNPQAGLVQATNGDFYGSTAWGGASDKCVNGCGTIFVISSDGRFTTLHSFAGGPRDGDGPSGGLIQATDGRFYGTTEAGGVNDAGTIFKVTPGGDVTILHSFEGSDGSYPAGGLIQAISGGLYGTTLEGGNGAGTVFKITLAGVFTSLYSFTNGADGGAPLGGVVEATDGDFYGPTQSGGEYGNGTIFVMTPNGTVTTAYNFCSPTSCGTADPVGGLIQATDGNLYGTTSGGTIFNMTPGGQLTTLLTVPGGLTARLLQATNGNVYGTTAQGGTNYEGTIFGLSVGLGPFVTTQPTSGKAGSVVKILGTNLTGATRVTFNGVASGFDVYSSSEIEAFVPNEATTGKVQVVTPTATLSSNVSFRIRP
jgi:uncharacterized repeat protein (TIGR03803 family)